MIIVCSLNDLETVCNSLKPKNLISVIDPGYEPETPLGVKNHLKIESVLLSALSPSYLVIFFTIFCILLFFHKFLQENNIFQHKS